MDKQNNPQKGETIMKNNKSTAQTTTKHKEEVMNQITFTVEKMYRLPDAGKLKAFADVSVNDALIIKGIRVLEGKKGIFVSMPQEQGKDNKWYDQVVCKSPSVYEAFSEALINHYNQTAMAGV
jgi:stage V sporulation protein G